MDITITEALAEIPTIGKRIEKKQAFILGCLYRQSGMKDPHSDDGGSAELIARELQAIGDLQTRLVAIRAAIQKANAETTITIGTETKTIADWLTWRREVAPRSQELMRQMASKLNAVRQQAKNQGVTVKETDAGYTADYVININERDLATRAENLEEVLGALDGQLSLKNATVAITLP